MAVRVKVKNKKKVKRVKTGPSRKIEITADAQKLGGTYANLVQVGIQPEELVMDFFSRVGDNAVHNARVFITPSHAQRLLILLKQQLDLHKKLHGRVRKAHKR
jgi:hypothetical protein